MRLSKLAGVTAMISLGFSCVHRLPEYGHAKLTESVMAAEQALAVGDYSLAEQKAQSGAAELRSNRRDESETIAQVGLEREPELWKRLEAVDTALNRVVADSAPALTALAKKGDVAGYERLRDFVVHRQKVVVGPFDKPRLEEEARHDLVASTCAAALEMFLGRGQDDGARAQLTWCPRELNQVVGEFLRGPPGCHRAQRGLASLASADVAPALRGVLLERAKECVTELSAADASADDRLSGPARGVDQALQKLGVAIETEPRKALQRPLGVIEERRATAATAKKEADAERERRLAEIKGELERAAARNDVQKVCALAKANDLPVPDALRGPELAARAEREAHKKQAENPEWPATAWLHSLWLGPGGSSPPPVARAWDEPLARPSWDWSGIVIDDGCRPMDAPPLAPRPSRKPAAKVDALGFAVKAPVYEPVSWKVLSYACAPASGRLVEYAVFERSRVYVARLRNEAGMQYVPEMVDKKVGTQSVKLNARVGAVSVTVQAPVGHQALVFTSSREVDNIVSETDRGFAFALAGIRGGSYKNQYNFLTDLGQHYDAEVEALKKAWRATGRNRAAPDAEREEAFARLALIEGNDAEAVQYFREKYRLTGDRARALSLPPVPPTCP